MEWREPREDEHELLIKFLRGEDSERIFFGVISVTFFSLMAAGAVYLWITGRTGVLSAVIMLIFGILGIPVMLIGFKSNGKLKLARAKGYHVLDCRVRDRVVNQGYKRASYYVNVNANNGKRYKIKVNGATCRQAEEGRRAIIVGYKNDHDDLPWDLIIRKDTDEWK